MSIGAQLLTPDWNQFQHRYPDAAAFIRAATLRKEYFMLLLSERRGFLTDNQRYRLAELRSGVPALEEAWYLEFLRVNGVGPWAEETSE